MQMFFLLLLFDFHLLLPRYLHCKSCRSYYILEQHYILLPRAAHLINVFYAVEKGHQLSLALIDKNNLLELIIVRFFRTPYILPIIASIVEKYLPATKQCLTMALSLNRVKATMHIYYKIVYFILFNHSNNLVRKVCHSKCYPFHFTV